jgi:hypothetical protein
MQKISAAKFHLPVPPQQLGTDGDTSSLLLSRERGRPINVCYWHLADIEQPALMSAIGGKADIPIQGRRVR